ncbi:MAG: hypothetical protein ACRDLF_01625 [Solirubrobacteraceae bacterium]
MKHLRIAGLCLVSMFVMSMALAGNAAAALLWLVCLERSGTLTKYNNNQCTEASGTGKWQSLGLTVCPENCSDTVRLLAFTLKLEDSNAAAIQCSDVGNSTGLIESGNTGIIREARITKALAESLCEVRKPFLTCKAAGNIEGVEGRNLPWTIEIFTTENKNLTQIKAEKGKPGWAVTCGGATDTCEEEAGKPEFAELLNGVTKGVLLVLARFEEKGPAKCSVGGVGAGHVTGLVAVLLWSGNGLSINPR